MTIYAGDAENDKLIVVPKQFSSPLYIDLQKKPPFCGVLINNDTALIIGCLFFL